MRLFHIGRGAFFGCPLPEGLVTVVVCFFMYGAGTHRKWHRCVCYSAPFARWIQRELIADSMRVSGKRGRERIELRLFCVAGWNNVRSWFAARESRCYATLSLKTGGTEAGEAIVGRRLR